MSSLNQHFLLDFLTNSDKISIRTSLQEWGNEMKYDKELIAGKLRRWEKYMDEYRLPDWDDIPNFGLYMEQVVVLLSEYLDYLPPELKKEQFITAATINNYVRKEIMPEPIKKRYYRLHIAYLIIICTLKQSLSIQTLQTVIPMGLSEKELKSLYNNFAERQRATAIYFVDQVRLAAANILDHETDPNNGIAAKDTFAVGCAFQRRNKKTELFSFL